MRIAIQADDGDQVSICADVISVEQAAITVEIENALYSNDATLENVTLSVEKARELAQALMTVAEAVEFVRAPTNPLEWVVNSADSQRESRDAT